jgi:hypothetical protein
VQLGTGLEWEESMVKVDDDLQLNDVLLVASCVLVLLRVEVVEKEERVVVYGVS